MARFAWAWMPVTALVLGAADPAALPARPVAPARPPADRSSMKASTRQADAAADLPPALPPPSAGVGTAPGGSPLATDLTFRPTPTAPGDVPLPINLATALRLSDARPLVVAAAQAGVWVAEAELTRAKVLWIPTLNIGFDYLRHDGGGPDFNKGIMTAPSVNFFYAGAGLWGVLPTTDAIFEPLAARQVLDAQHWKIQAAKNDVLMDTADAYFRVHRTRGTYAGALYCVERGRDLVARIESLSRELVPRVEVDRAKNMLADMEQRAAENRQGWRVESADLTRVLRLDPRSVVVPLEHDHAQVTLIDPGRSLDDLMSVALVNRPELSAQQALVNAAEIGVRREKARPFIPNVLLNGFQTPYEMLQAGIFGMGPNGSLNQWRGRADVSIQPLWQLENLGIGNLARIKGQRGQESLAMIELFRTQDRVAAEVTQAQARVQSAAARVFQADRSLRTGIATFNGTFEGLGQTRRFGDVLELINRPQEAVFALQLLYVAFEEYFGTVAEYNRAQFELFRALGYPAREVSCLRLPGATVPVNLGRPPFLPPVGNGPPPATR